MRIPEAACAFFAASTSKHTHRRARGPAMHRVMPGGLGQVRIAVAHVQRAMPCHPFCLGLPRQSDGKGTNMKGHSPACATRLLANGL